jgi:hypothetical protein
MFRSAEFIEPATSRPRTTQPRHAALTKSSRLCVHQALDATVTRLSLTAFQPLTTL